jgi:hypothetical protein
MAVPPERRGKSLASLLEKLRGLASPCGCKLRRITLTGGFVVRIDFSEQRCHRGVSCDRGPVTIDRQRGIGLMRLQHKVRALDSRIAAGDRDRPVNSLPPAA